MLVALISIAGGNFSSSIWQQAYLAYDVDLYLRLRTIYRLFGGFNVAFNSRIPGSQHAHF